MHQLGHEAGSEALLFHAFRHVIEGHHVERLAGSLSSHLHLGMRQTDTPVEKGGLGQHQISNAATIGLGHPLGTVEPHQLHEARAIAESCHHATTAPLALHAEVHDLPFELHIGHAVLQIADAVDDAAVHVFVRETVEHVAYGCDLQLLVEDAGTGRANALEELDVGL